MTIVGDRALDHLEFSFELASWNKGLPAGYLEAKGRLMCREVASSQRSVEAIVDGEVQDRSEGLVSRVNALTDRQLARLGGSVTAAIPFRNVFANHFNNVIRRVEGVDDTRDRDGAEDETRVR